MIISYTVDTSFFKNTPFNRSDERNPIGNAVSQLRDDGQSGRRKCSRTFGHLRTVLDPRYDRCFRKDQLTYVIDSCES